MLALKPFVEALLYVPLRSVDAQAVMDKLRIRIVTQDEVNLEGDVEEETVVDAANEEILCYDLSKRGYIGVPRTYGIEKLGISKFINLTTFKRPRPELFVRKIRPRDKAQQDFMNELCVLVRSPKPVDIVANARTGTGKTITALYVIENAIQAPTLITVPTTYLLNQWRSRIRGMMGDAWFEQYVGHIQQNKMDYDGRLIVLGVAASLARRDYPRALRQYFSAIIFDEWHSIGTPSMGRILARYPASVRIGLTATNRRDALLKVCTLHLGKPRAVSKQEVERPTVFVVPYRKTLPRTMSYPSENYMTSLLARFKDRNDLLCRIIADGYQRGMNSVGLSDRTDQLQVLIHLLVRDYGVAEEDIGLLCGQYKDHRTGKKIKMKQAEKDRVAGTCKIIATTWGQFATGADIDRLDMGVELTPRSNVRQGLGRVLRILAGKPTPEWYSIKDEIMVYPELAQTASLFAPDNPTLYQPLLDMAKAREGSFADQRGTVQNISADSF
ncbi:MULTISPECIES: DEAD/DEAH box helicase family protein [unclassified Bradyrhizobium]|uniref:DEAD/DEAH box helicase n=1 Tax=unclassified Bradyrhizobium TaxID=2631580 RepID=UPI003397759B